MSTIIMIDGGIGRVITSIPALLKYSKKNPNNDWYVMIHGWDFVTWGIPELQERTFNPDEKNSFDIFLKADKIITAEPYRVPKYYKNEISLVEAFDFAINGTEDHSDLPPMTLKLSRKERIIGSEIIISSKDFSKKEKTIVIQPYGSSATQHSSGAYDASLRSIPDKMLKYLIDNLTKDYNVIYMGAKEFHNNKTYKPSPDPHMREWIAVIEQSDYFIGCDSCGQHMCKALNKKASVVLTSTHRTNVTYDDFHIIERDAPLYPDAMRISGFRADLSSRLNEERCNFTDEEIERAYKEIVEKIENKKEEPNTKNKNITY